jgi:hypothetical protein
MAKQNVPLISFNRGLISPLALARIDLDRTRLSASKMTNWLPKTQGSMILRPGTKYRGSSLNDTGAVWIEFAAATDEAALLEMTNGVMRIWEADTGTITLISRPPVSATVTISDTGWTNVSTGGEIIGGQFDAIPKMTAATTNGVTLSASTEDTANNRLAWKAADDKSGPFQNTYWATTVAAPGWLLVDFGAGVTKKIKNYSLKAPATASTLSSMPNSWTLEGNATDTGFSDTGNIEVTVSGETGWSTNEKREYSDTGWTDTGANAWRYWRLNISAADGGPRTGAAEFELFEDSGGGHVTQNAQGIVLNATALGSRAIATKRVIIGAADTGVEHSLHVDVSKGPITFRTGSTPQDDDYIGETTLGTGHHHLSFTPTTDFHITLQNNSLVDRTVNYLSIGDTGTVEVETPWTATDIDNIRYDQSADVVYVDAAGIKPHKIERRGTGRSWSVVEYTSDLGPFIGGLTSTAKLNVSNLSGNTKINSDVPFFKPSHEGALFRITNDGQSGIFNLGAKDAVTDAIRVTGIGDTAEIINRTNQSERYIQFKAEGTYDGEITIERSFDDPEYGFKEPSAEYLKTATTSVDTGTFTLNIHDLDDNITVWYRARRTDTGIGSGVATVTVTYPGGLTTGIARATGYIGNQTMDAEIIRRFSDTGLTDDWQEGSWSGVRGYPSVPVLHEGRLGHAGKANIWISASDDYENFDDEIVGEAKPINRTLGSGPVDNIYGMLSLSRLVVGTAGSEIVIKSSSLDEPLTAVNASARPFSTQGIANLRMVAIDSRGFFVQRSKGHVFSVSFGQSVETASDYESSEMTVLVPELLEQGVVSIAVQRQPDTRLHCVLADGKVAILTYEPQEQVLAWSLWETDGTVEQAMVLPGVGEDKVFYHINRTIGGATKRFLEQWAMESECQGDTGLSWLADCAVSYTDTGRTTDIQGIDHLIGESVIAWANDSGQTNAGKDLSPDDTGMNQTTYVVDTGGNITLTEDVHHVVAGLPYTADYRSTKLAYAAQAGTALTQLKRSDKIGFVMNQVHNNGLYFGTDTGDLDPLPRVIDADTGGGVDANKIFAEFDQVSMPFPGLWDSDSRIFLRAKAPRPVTVMGAVPSVITHEK